MRKSELTAEELIEEINRFMKGEAREKLRAQEYG